jgi:hypothetical protein
MNNHEYNIMNQLIQEQKSLWRIEGLYLNEAQSDEEKAVWEKIKADKQSHVQELKKLVKGTLE